ncbi:MAG: response regulator transcription factor [Rhodothermales bacterium]
MSAAPLRVTLVEDDPGIRAGLCAVLDAAEGFVCTGVFGSVEEMLARFDGAADVMLMDIHLPLLSGVDGVPLLKERHPTLPVVMLTVYDDAERVFAALKAGATGYLLKRTPPDQLLDALADVHRGGAPMSASIARKVVDSFHAPAPEAPVEADLSPREREVLHYLAQGYRYKEIAEALFISPETVRSHLRKVYDKLHVRSRTEAVVKYLGR